MDIVIHVSIRVNNVGNYQSKQSKLIMWRYWTPDNMFYSSTPRMNIEIYVSIKVNSVGIYQSKQSKFVIWWNIDPDTIEQHVL